MLSYSLKCDYQPIYPPVYYPSAAPYAALTKVFSKLIRERVIHSRLVKQLLYPEYLNKMNLSLVKIRHHKTECVIMTKQASDCHRFSIVKCDSDSDTDDDSTDSSDPCQVLARQNALDNNSSGDDESSSSNPFGYIRYYNPQNDIGSETKYESFIDYGEPVVYSSEAKMADDAANKKSSVTVTSTAKVELTHQNSESSEASSNFAPKPYLACEDLVHIDENLPMGKTTKPYIPTTRQSLPTKFVGNKFSQSSLTTIDIPQWQSNSDNCLNKVTNFSLGGVTTTHSSNLDLEVNTTLALPDKVVAGLLYNFDADEKPTIFTKSESIDSDKSYRTVIKPPTVFQNATTSTTTTTTTNPISLSLENVGFRKHSINSDKPKRRSSIHVPDSGIRRCVSSHFIQMGYDNSSCCMMEMCHSPRSSDSGMAGSCTLNSPDFGVTDQERCSIDLSSSDFLLKRELFGGGDSSSSKVLSLSEMEARDFNSQCPCTSPFGSTPRTSCDTPVSSSMSSHHHPSDLISTSPKLAESPRCIETWEPASKSKSLDCLKIAEANSEKTEIFKSGLYAHWWLKAKIPACVVKGIYEETRSPNTGKGFWVFFFFCFVLCIQCNIQLLLC